MLSAMISRHRMEPCMRPLCSDHNCCSVLSPLSTHTCHSRISTPNTVYGCSVMAPSCAAPLSFPQRCLCASHCSQHSSVICNKVDFQRTFPCLTLLRVNERVLARRQSDGFYYLATVKREEEAGMFLIEFDKPCAEGEKYQAILQKTEVGDIIEYFDALRHCVVPGDNVLAPWETNLIRYGPGTVTMGLETRDPLRATEDEELTVIFWNGKKTTVPLGVAVWISPSSYRKVADMLHRPISSRQKQCDRDLSSTTYVFTDRFTSVPVPTCTAEHHHIKHNWHHHVAHPHHTLQHCSCCCFPTHAKCTCCYDRKCQDWWPLSPRTTVYVQGSTELQEDNKINSTPRSIESPKREDTSSFLSYSSMSEDADSEDDSDAETHLSKSTQSTRVDSAVNTDSSLWDKPKLDMSDRPDWKYWKRSHPEPHHRKPGSHMSSKKFNKTSKSDTNVSFMDPVGPSNHQSSLFETIVDSSVRRLTMKDVLVHKDFDPSYRQPVTPAVERLGESEMEKLRQKRTALEQKLRQRIQHREWEQNREKQLDQNYSDKQEAHRKKTLNRLKNEEQKVKEEEMKNIKNTKAKKHAREIKSVQMQTQAVEDKQKEQRRLDHLRHVREKIDLREFEKCATNEQKEINNAEARRRKVENHYRQVAEKVFEAEQNETWR